MIVIHFWLKLELFDENFGESVSNMIFFSSRNCGRRFEIRHFVKRLQKWCSVKIKIRFGSRRRIPYGINPVLCLGSGLVLTRNSGWGDYRSVLKLEKPPFDEIAKGVQTPLPATLGIDRKQSFLKQTLLIFWRRFWQNGYQKRSCVTCDWKFEFLDYKFCKMDTMHALLRQRSSRFNLGRPYWIGRVVLSELRSSIGLHTSSYHGAG